MSAARSSCEIMRSMRAASVSLLRLSRNLSTISGKASGEQRCSATWTISLFCSRSKLSARPRDVELVFQHLALGLAQQPVFGIVFAKHVVEQAGRRLQLARALALRRDSRRRRARRCARCRGSAGAPARRRSGSRAISSRQIIECARGAISSGSMAVPVARVGAQKLEAVVVDGEREGAWRDFCAARQAMRLARPRCALRPANG